MKHEISLLTSLPMDFELFANTCFIFSQHGDRPQTCHVTRKGWHQDLYKPNLRARGLGGQRVGGDFFGSRPEFLDVIPSLKLTAHPYKWMVGILLSYWGPAYFQGRTVSFREVEAYQWMML